MRVWIASLLFYSFVFIVCELLRYVVYRWLSRRLPRLLTGLLLEFIGILQVCTPMFDVNLILETYGLFGIFIEITAIEIANAFLLRDAIAHPCPLVTAASRKRSILRRVILVFGTQLAAAYLSYFLARTFWKLGLHEKHIKLLTADHCEADLTVALTAGSLIEGFATFGAKAVEFFAHEWYVDSQAQMLINCIFAGFLTAIVKSISSLFAAGLGFYFYFFHKALVMITYPLKFIPSGINYTGMYANPIVAWACTFNCEGISQVGHLIVYWLSPLIGWYFADAVFGEQECTSECFIEEPENDLNKFKSI